MNRTALRQRGRKAAVSWSLEPAVEASDYALAELEAALAKAARAAARDGWHAHRTRELEIQVARAALRHQGQDLAGWTRGDLTAWADANLRGRLPGPTIEAMRERMCQAEADRETDADLIGNGVDPITRGAIVIERMLPDWRGTAAGR